MAAPTPMDISDAGGDKSRNNSLAVNKSNNKIGKNARGRNLTPPRPDPKVIHIEVTDFLRTVQELTAQEPAPSAPRTVNSRLSSLAPPPLPLRPSVSYGKMPQPPHLPALMSPTQNGQRVMHPLPGFTGFPNVQQRLSPRAVSPMPLLTPGTFGPLPPLSPTDRWADFESPSTSFMMQAAQAMASQAAPRVEAAAPPALPPVQLPSRLDPGNGGFPSFYYTQALASYAQYAPKPESSNGMHPPFPNRMESGMAAPPPIPLRMLDAATIPPPGLHQLPHHMHSAGFATALPQSQTRMESGGAAAAGFSQLLPRMDPAAGNTFSQFPSRMESGFGSFPPLSPRMDAQGLAQPFSPLSPTFGLAPLSPTMMSLPPLSPSTAFPFSPLGYGNQDFGFGLNNVYGGFANNLSPTAGLTNEAFSFHDRVLS